MQISLTFEYPLGSPQTLLIFAYFMSNDQHTFTEFFANMLYKHVLQASTL